MRAALAFLVALCALAGCVLAGSGFPTYSNVLSASELGLGTRAIALGEAFVGLADDQAALAYNPAGLGWFHGSSVILSREQRELGMSCGDLAAVFGRVGAGVAYFDFGDVPEADQYGNIVGSFSYRSRVFLVGAGARLADLPALSGMRFAESLGFGLVGKYVATDTNKPGTCSGLSVDATALFRCDTPLSGIPQISRLSFGGALRNLLATPLAYESGHSEHRQTTADVGMAMEIEDKVRISLEVTGAPTAHLGVEWLPVPSLALRFGIKQDGAWIWSIGAGLHIGWLVFDIATVNHPYLGSRMRVSLGSSW
ncbi:MAG: hypothetical protein ABFD77_06855 [Thermotogota bacterium]